MALSHDGFKPSLPRAGSVHARDHGLKRARSLTRWIALAAMTIAAALGTFYTQLLPGSPGSADPAGPPAPASSTSIRNDDDDAIGEQAGQRGEEEDEDEDEDEGAARIEQQTPQPPVEPPTATQQHPDTMTGAS
ncbi:hypothetical protein [Streptomyces sp. NPDC051776]|uniref:hypothetical protein n=1 Tax=Streptomyces sp. NPDC051776 TaxID=3155414 RepID=UPI003432EBAB